MATVEALLRHQQNSAIPKDWRKKGDEAKKDIEIVKKIGLEGKQLQTPPSSSVPETVLFGLKKKPTENCLPEKSVLKENIAGQATPELGTLKQARIYQKEAHVTCGKYLKENKERTTPGVQFSDKKQQIQNSKVADDLKLSLHRKRQLKLQEKRAQQQLQQQLQKLKQQRQQLIQHQQWLQQLPQLQQQQQQQLKLQQLQKQQKRRLQQQQRWQQLQLQLQWYKQPQKLQQLEQQVQQLHQQQLQQLLQQQLQKLQQQVLQQLQQVQLQQQLQQQLQELHQQLQQRQQQLQQEQKQKELQLLQKQKSHQLYIREQHLQQRQQLQHRLILQKRHNERHNILQRLQQDQQQYKQQVLQQHQQEQLDLQQHFQQEQQQLQQLYFQQQQQHIRGLYSSTRGGLQANNYQDQEGFVHQSAFKENSLAGKRKQILNFTNQEVIVGSSNESKNNNSTKHSNPVVWKQEQNQKCKQISKFKSKLSGHLQQQLRKKLPAGISRNLSAETKKKVLLRLERKADNLENLLLHTAISILKKRDLQLAKFRQQRPVPTPTPITIPRSITTPLSTPRPPRLIPTPTPITTPTPIPTPIPTPRSRTTPIAKQSLIPTPTTTPTPTPTPTTAPTPQQRPITTPTPSISIEEGRRLHNIRIQLLLDVKVREDQAIDERENLLKKSLGKQSKSRIQESDTKQQVRVHEECLRAQQIEAEDIRLRRLQNPNYQPPTKKEIQLQKRLLRQQQEYLKYQQFPPGPRHPLCQQKMMHNEMVSLPVGNLNGGLKATSTGSGVGTSSVVSSAVLANAPRVYLTPTATFMANRQAAAVAAAQVTGKIGGATIVGVGSATSTSAATVASSGTVRYFSQFSKLQTAGGNGASPPTALQKKLINGDTIVLSNGTKSRILTSNSSSSSGVVTTATSIATAATVTRSAAAVVASTNGGISGNRCLITNKMEPLVLNEPVIKNNDDDDDDAPEASIQQEQPLELVAGNSSDGDEPELDITINNVVCSFSVRCHLKLREIALNGSNVEYRRENGMVTMKLRHPYTTASIWSSGRITCTGATSEPMAKVAARRYARCLGKLGFPTRFQNFRIVNVLGTCSMPWAIKIVNFSERHRANASYEPELHPGVTYKMIEPKATLKIFSTGSITVTAASVNDVESAIQHIYPLVYEFRKQRSPEELQHLRQKQRRLTGGIDPNELEEIIASENKAAAVNDIFVNTTTAHTTKTTTDGTDQVNSIATAAGSSAINAVQRSKQLESYRNMMQQTQEERRHIPFHGSSTTATALNASKPSTSAAAAAAATTASSTTTDNICASARRRATECWATKLQNKRPRYNAASTASTNNSFSNVASTSAQAQAQAQAQSQAQAQTHLRNPLKTAALANARMRGTGQTPMNLVLNPSSSSTSSSSVAAASRLVASGNSAGFLQAQQRQQQQQRLLQQQQQQLQQKLLGQQRSFSPSDFQVDDLIEEEESNELDCLRLNNTGTLREHTASNKTSRVTYSVASMISDP